MSKCGQNEQQFAGPHNSGGFWNDGCLPLVPGWGCKGEGDSIYDGDDPSDNCMTNRRFLSMCFLPPPSLACIIIVFSI